jgi:hypothetical protein
MNSRALLLNASSQAEIDRAAGHANVRCNTKLVGVHMSVSAARQSTGFA